MLKNEDIHGIVGPTKLTEETFITEVGKRAQVPVISFTARSSNSHPQNPYSIWTRPHDSNQVKALAAICKRFEWHEVVILYEDTNYGSQFSSELNNEFLKMDIQLAHAIAISTSSEDYYINTVLKRLMAIQTRVFIVHMNAVLGVRLFLLAKRAGMMSDGYAWLVTDSLGNFLNSMDSTVFDSMEGVLGIRPHVPKSERLESFRERWKRTMLLKKPESSKMELNVYGLWAYDTIWALATAVERIGLVNSDLLNLNKGENDNDPFHLRKSQLGPKLVDELYNITFDGLIGEFQLIDGKLKPSALEIFNVIGTGDRIIGYWMPKGGITQKEFKSILWPGDTVKKPLGWSIPSTGKLKVGVPKKKGFTEFVNVTTDPLTNQSIVTGFAIDIFLCALNQLPFKLDYEFIPFMYENGSPKGTYDDLLHNMTLLQVGLSLLSHSSFSLFIIVVVFSFDCNCLLEERKMENIMFNS